VNDARKTQTIRDIVQQEIRKFLMSKKDHSASMQDVAAYIMNNTSCKSKTTFYRYASEIKDMEKEYTNKGVVCKLRTPQINQENKEELDFPAISDLKDITLRENLQRSIKNMNIDNIDLALFQLGKILKWN
jgi:hypothetical protein